MRWVYLRLTILGLLIFGSLRVSASQAAPTALVNPFQQLVEDVQHDIAKWDRDAGIQIGFVIAIVTFGALIAVFQKSSQPWCKWTTIALGLCTSVLTGVSAKVFPADYRSYQNAAIEGRAVLKRLEVINASFLMNPPTPEDLVTFKKDFTDRIEEFNNISKRLEGNTQANIVPTNTAARETKSTWIQVLRPVYAQSVSDGPSWIQKLPSDDRDTYFRGQSSQASLSKAKVDSLDDAIKRASAALTPSEVYDDSTFVRDMAAVQDTFFVFDKQSSNYTYYTLLRISSATAHPATSTYKKKDWRPIALAYNPTSGMFALDDSGSVSKIRFDREGIHLLELFRIRGSDRPADLTADSQSVFTSSNNKIGCTIYQYSVATKKTSQRLIPLSDGYGGCDGIAADGGAVYIVLAGRREIRSWPNWGTSAFNSLDLSQINPRGGVLVMDKDNHRLIYADQLGKAYSIDLSGGMIKTLSSDVGAVHAIAASPNQFLLASGTKVLFYSKPGFQGENPPNSMKSLGGGILSGVAVDSSNSAWLANFDKGTIEGPLPLS
jgi:hypothetical protein